MADQETPIRAWTKEEEKYNSKKESAYVDPCQEAADRSLKCLRRNGGARDMCMDYFDAYRDCKKNWLAQVKEAKRKEGRWF